MSMEQQIHRLLSWVPFFHGRLIVQEMVCCLWKRKLVRFTSRKTSQYKINSMFSRRSIWSTYSCRKKPLNNLQRRRIKVLLTPSAHCWPHGTGAAAAALVYHLPYRHWHLLHVKPGYTPFLCHHHLLVYVVSPLTLNLSAPPKPAGGRTNPWVITPFINTCVTMWRLTDLEFPDRGSVVIHFPVKSVSRVHLWKLERSGKISAPEAFSDDSPVTL